MIREKLRLALLISGGGTTAREIIRACRDGRLPRLEPACIIASNTEASGLEKAKTEGLAEKHILVIDPTTCLDEEDFADSLIKACKDRHVGIIGQFGWMPKTPLKLIEAYFGRMINQHPGPLDPGRPDFGGKGMFGRRVHCARLFFLREANRIRRDMWTEATAQRVAENYDEGAVLKRARVPIFENDDPISLQERVLPVEHDVQIATLRDFSEDHVREILRDEPLVRPQEVPILKEAKRIARIRFPTG